MLLPNNVKAVHPELVKIGYYFPKVSPHPETHEKSAYEININGRSLNAAEVTRLEEVTWDGKLRYIQTVFLEHAPTFIMGDEGFIRGNQAAGTTELAVEGKSLLVALSLLDLSVKPLPKLHVMGPLARMSFRVTKVEIDPPLRQKISMKLEYLPDFSEEYAINLKPGLGTGNFEFELENGWNLTSLNAETDQQTAEIIGSIGSLIGALSPTPGVLEKSAQNPSLNLTQQAPAPPATIYGSNVPFGFYEAVIACDPHGRKQLYGWRYVGFMPFQACPVEPRGAQQVCCDTQDIYGMVFVNGVLQFQKIHEIPTMPIDPTSPWPPQAEAVTSRDKAPQVSRVSHKFQEKR